MTVNENGPSAVDGWTQRLGRLLLPPRCLACGEPAPGPDLCAACAAELPRNHGACRGCALPLPTDEPAASCGRCLRRPPPFAATLAPFLYAAPLDRLLPRLKFHGDLAAGRVLADLLAAAAGAALETGLPRPEALVPVPLHRARLRQRGYDQALEIAVPVARALRIPLRTDLLLRRQATAAQSELAAAARARNVRQAFAVPASIGAPPTHVALIDDVMTTGATLAACARALRRAGVVRVDAWVVARVGQAW
ncbi:ComF family protein [Coralloluteibacterium stylophorae]|uniref:ComF family protein n=1 Tax=Coralloluteibacterium stylophorae TaxID=1776034 RepID=A0A8J8AYK4_9GAMM|nr:ComF family protein [Coralloluteibacterium stylophorae]MBS7457143.1 ComF family protein [Coralloluteibacterium stylophorae]